MNITICIGDSKELQLLTEFIEQVFMDKHIPLHVESCTDWPSLAAKLQQDMADIVFVALDGVRGLDAVASAQYLVPHIIWASDLDFATQSYRMGISYFLLKPISYTKIERAIERCLEINHHLAHV